MIFLNEKTFKAYEKENFNIGFNTLPFSNAATF